MTPIARPLGTAAWLDARRPYWNASAAAALFHEHPFLTLAGVVRSKLDPTIATEENAAMRRGRHLEEAIATWWSEEHGIALWEPAVMYAEGALLATLDRRIVGNDDEAVEIKTTAKHVTGVERYWWWQVQCQAHCADLARVHVAVLDASMDLKSYVVERDEEAIDRLVDAAAKVMHHVALGEWPPDVADDPPARHSERVLELDVQGVSDLQQWLALRAELADVEALEQAAKKRIEAALGDAQAATIDGRTVLTYRSHERSNVDLTRLRKEHAELAAELATTTTVRVLRPTRAS